MGCGEPTTAGLGPDKIYKQVVQDQAKSSSPQEPDPMPPPNVNPYDPYATQRQANPSPVSEPVYRLGRRISRFLTGYGEPNEQYWMDIARRTFAMLPDVLHNAFIEWVGDEFHRDRLTIYEAGYQHAVLKFLAEQYARLGRDRLSAMQADEEMARRALDDARIIQALKDELSAAHLKSEKITKRIANFNQAFAGLFE